MTTVDRDADDASQTRPRCGCVLGHDVSVVRNRLKEMLLRGWRHRLGLGLAASVVLITFAGVTARLFVWPATDAVRHVDAVVIFAGGRGERLDLAEQLMDDGVASNLVIPNGLAAGWPEGNRACTQDRPYAVHCPRPEPDTTVGEARTLAALAEDEAWDSLLVVTSTYHLSRAGLLLARCFDGDVLAARARPDLGWLEWGSRIGHEWLAWTRAAAVARAC